jgi:hypothetical protein
MLQNGANKVSGRHRTHRGAQCSNGPVGELPLARAAEVLELFQQRTVQHADRVPAQPRSLESQAGRHERPPRKPTGEASGGAPAVVEVERRRAEDAEGLRVEPAGELARRDRRLLEEPGQPLVVLPDEAQAEQRGCKDKAAPTFITAPQGRTCGSASAVTRPAADNQLHPAARYTLCRQKGVTRWCASPGRLRELSRTDAAIQAGVDQGQPLRVR